MKRLSEAECQRTIVEAAKRGGWRVHAERTSLTQSGRYATAIQGDAGWPDLVLAHSERGLYFVELKRKPNKLTDDQHKWRDVLNGAAAYAGYDTPIHGSEMAQVWWMPEELDTRVQWLVNA